MTTSTRRRMLHDVRMRIARADMSNWTVTGDVLTPEGEVKGSISLERGTVPKRLLVPGDILHARLENPFRPEYASWNRAGEVRDPDPLIHPVALASLMTVQDGAARLEKWLGRAFAHGHAWSHWGEGDPRNKIYEVQQGVLALLTKQTDDMHVEAGRVTVRAELPEMMVNAMRGARIGDVLGHPLFRGMTDRIEEVERPSSGRLRLVVRFKPVRIRECLSDITRARS